MLDPELAAKYEKQAQMLANKVKKTYNHLRKRFARVARDRRSLASQYLGNGPDNATRRGPQHAEQHGAEQQQAILREIGKKLRQQHDQQGAEHRSPQRSCATDHHGEDEQDGL